MAKLATIWITKPEDRTDVENALRNSPVFAKLRKIIADRLDSLDRRETNLNTYENQSWSHVQAHLNGQKQELKFLFSLLDLGDSE